MQRPHDYYQQHVCNNEDNIIRLLQQYIYKIYLAFLFMTTCILSLLCIIMYYRQLNEKQTSKIIKKVKAKVIVNKKTLQQKLNDLPQFTSVLPVGICSIQSTQKQNILDVLIQQAERTKLFVMSSPNLSSDFNHLSFYFAFIQESRILIFSIDYSHDTDHNTTYFWALEHFFIVLFHSSNTMYTWGNILPQLKVLERYDLFNIHDINKDNFIDIQKKFTPWYNNIFGHELTCQQFLKYDDIDGPLCSCAHRPYKSSLCQWSLSRAIMYTFEQRFPDHPHGIAQCLAIVKLAHAIEKVENNQELKQLQ